ncbi:MAG: phosphate regulon sensor histidine kinase PhoR [Ectothiorhodospiraceae bacterium]|jgi:two-component system phosphate regulon sensor histidine kinase PhoR
MLVRNPWPAAALRLLALVAVALVIGAVAGHVWAALLFGLGVYLGVHLRNLWRLEQWLRQGRRFRPPEAQGLWGTVFDNLYRRQRRYRQRRLRLAELLRRFKESANAMPDATVVLRGNGQMVWWNTMATVYLGLRWPQDQGQRIANLFRHPSFSEFLQRREWTESIKVPSPVDDQMVLEIRVVPYGQNQKLLLARDVTRLHRLETMRRDFVANITHELRTPLTVIRGMAETVGEYGITEAEDLERPLALIQEQTRRMGRLIDDLLLLSRLETNSRRRDEVVAVAEMIDGVVADARALSDEGHRIVVESDAELRLRGDEGELRSAFSNLVVNAVKYTPSPGEIAVRWYADGDGAHFSVTDTGEGIAPHHIPRLTERFYRVDSGRSSKSGGTGLGLAIVKHVLGRHDGHLDVRSRLGEGSTFDCVFPERLMVRSGGAAARRAVEQS